MATGPAPAAFRGVPLEPIAAPIPPVFSIQFTIQMEERA